MKQRSKRVLNAVLSGLLATSMFAALPGEVHAEEPMVEEKTEVTAQSNAQPAEDIAQPVEVAAQSPTQSHDPTTHLTAESSVPAEQSDMFPAKFDLRDRGVVTSVKKQDPWNTCWSFSASAASEISILTELGMTSDQFAQQNGRELDLSEKHLAWFASQPVTASVDPKQEGEGLCMLGDMPSNIAPYKMGGFGLYVTTLFSSGVGPVEEGLFPYQGATGLTEKQYLKANPEEGKAYVRSIAEAQLGMTLEQAVTNTEDENVKPVLQRLYEEGYLNPGDSLTVQLLENALYARFLAKTASDSSYAKQDDWTIPELNEAGQPNRSLTSGYTLKDGNILPEPSIKDANKKWVDVNWDGVSAVKSELMKGHGVSAGFKADQASPGDPINPDGYLNVNTWAHYTHEEVPQNHAICIVGWDDNYSAENFNANHRPPGNGAWLAKNSWGSETDCQAATEDTHIGYGDWGLVDESGKHTGYFYLSYYDKTLSGCESMTYSTDLASSEGFGTMMYDYMPAMVKLDMDTSVQSSSLTKTANVFKNDAGFDVELRAVSTKTAQPNATVKYSVYRLNQDPANPEDGTLLAEVSGSYEYAGFHRESLKEGVAVRNGETISVVAEETVDDASEGRLYEYSVNAASSEARATSIGEPAYGVAVVNKGESFIYEEGKWTDWAEYEKRTEVSGQFIIDNFSIKAYVVAASEPEGLALAGSGHVQRDGDVPARAEGAGIVIGTTGESKRLESFSVSLPGDADGSVGYRAHVQGSGWSEWAGDGAPCGTTGESRRVEAVQMTLSGAVAATHSVWYRVHSQTYGWLGWASDGQAAGTAGQSRRAEAIEVQVLPKGERPADYAEGQASYVGAASGEAHVQRDGWAAPSTPLEFGTTGQSRRLEAVRLSVPNQPLPGGISYEVHARGIGWMPAASDGELAGTEGQSRRLEAVRVRLTGDLAAEGGYSVWYRVHSQTYGWLGWAHDGADAGTTGLSRRAEAVEVQILPQGQVPRGYDASQAACVTA